MPTADRPATPSQGPPLPPAFRHVKSSCLFFNPLQHLSRGDINHLFFSRINYCVLRQELGMVSEATEAHLSRTAAVLGVLESLNPRQRLLAGVSTWHCHPMETRPSPALTLSTGESSTFPGALHSIPVVIFWTELDRWGFWRWWVCGPWLVHKYSGYSDTKTLQTPHLTLFSVADIGNFTNFWKYMLVHWGQWLILGHEGTQAFPTEMFWVLLPSCDYKWPGKTSPTWQGPGSHGEECLGHIIRHTTEAARVAPKCREHLGLVMEKEVNHYQLCSKAKCSRRGSHLSD